MEFVSEVSLSSYIKSLPNKTVNETQAKPIIKSISEALKYLHSKNVVHRDIKMENILIGEASDVKLIDFGFSIAIDTNQKLSIFCGTPSYMAPEIVNREPYSFGADIWALGVLIYRIIKGEFPFKGCDDKQLFRKIN